MKLRFFITITILLISIACLCQPQNIDFKNYVNKQYDLMIDAYKKKDANQYEKIMNELIQSYHKLKSDEQKPYKSAIAGAYYNLCCTYSLLNNKTKALEYLDKSIQAGYYDYSHIQTDTDLDNIRNEEKYKQLLLPIREIGDYIYILKKATHFNSSEKRELPVFTYQNKENENLIALRNEFKLDSIAGNGNEISQIINLLHWVHYLIKHDGNNNNPEIKNAKSMIHICKTEKRGLNCRGLAIVLNECYLALGFKSRFITCLPKDSLGIDPDCHVINMVYSKTLKKWLWIDPTNDAYIMNEKGELLSIEEVRERIIKNQPVILNPDANWNRKVTATKEEYLFNYMAKNLYRFLCTVNSEFNIETLNKDKTIQYIELIPNEYFKQTPVVEDYKKGNISMKTFKTNNAEFFWKAPVE